MTAESLFSPPDMTEAHSVGAMCAHGALAAALGITVMEVMKLFAKKGWINLPMMMSAVSASGRRWEHHEQPQDSWDAVILIQWIGPWTQPGVPPRVACRYRHWVATRRGLIWDANWPEWISHSEWKERALDLVPARSTGWRVPASLRLLPH